MSVVPFIIDKTIVESQDKFILDGDVLFIGDFDKEQLSTGGDSNASYDLRVGDKYRDYRDNEAITFSKISKPIMLDPGKAITIKTLEYVHFPKTRLGYIIPKVSLLQDGVSNTASKVDPGYQGHLLVTVFNLGQKTVPIKYGQRFCNLTMLEVANGVLPRNKSPKELTGDGKASWKVRLSDFYRKHSVIFGYVFAGFMSLSILIKVIDFFKNK